jgi:hypothetical protein
VSLTSLLGLVFILVFAGIIIFFAQRTRRDTPVNLRDIPAFTRLRRGLGLAVEAGQRLHISLGHGGVFGVPGGSTLLGLGLLQRIARTASVSDYPPVATNGEALQNILAQETTQTAFDAVGAEGQYDSANTQLTGLTPFSYAAGALPVIYDQNVSVNVFTGSFGSEVGLMADAAERTNSTSLGGSENLTAQAVLYASTQDPLIGEELYAAGAYVQGGPMHLGSVRAQDILRWVVIGIILAGALLTLLGVL